MKLLHNRFILLWTVIVVLNIFASASLPTHDEPLIAVYTENSGVVSPAGKRLYVVVSQEGVMTYVDRVGGRLTNRSRTLTRSELSQLTSLLEDSKLKTLIGPLRAPVFHPRDYQTSIQISIHRSTGDQKIDLIDYDPSAGRDFPEAAKQVLCLLDGFTKSEYRVTQDCKLTW